MAEEEIELLRKMKKEAMIKENPIRGVAILRGKLFIVRGNSSNLEVYECDNFNFDRKLLNVPELVDAVDICSCMKNNCLYIMDKKKDRAPKEVMKISTEGKLLEKWFTRDNTFGFLSTTTEGNVIIAVQDKDMLLEYLPSGAWLREISLPEGIDELHEIKSDTERLTVSHSPSWDPLQGVCLMDKRNSIEVNWL